MKTLAAPMVLNKSFVLKVGANCCCEGCCDRIRRFLMRIAGMKKVKVSKDNAHLLDGNVMITVCGDGIDEADIVSQLRKRRATSGVEVLKRLPHRELPGLENSIDRTGPHDQPEKQKCKPPSCKPTDAAVPAQPMNVSASVDSNTAMKGEAVVTERVYDALEGTKIRTRVTTSRDACTCVRLEEVRFIIDKQQVVKSRPRSALAFDDTVSRCQNPGNLKLSISPIIDMQLRRPLVI